MKVKTIIKGVINFFGDYYCTLCMGTVYLTVLWMTPNLFDLLDTVFDFCNVLETLDLGFLQFFKIFLNTL